MCAEKFSYIVTFIKDLSPKEKKSKGGREGRMKITEETEEERW